MKLTTKLTVQKIRVIADYQRKENNPMFVAILKAAYENDNIITIDEAKNKLSGAALNTRMWENILDRLVVQNYFEKSKIVKNKLSEQEEYFARMLDQAIPKPENIKIYELTDFGKEAAEQNTFFKQMKGELEIWILKDKVDWFPFQIVKIEETSKSYQKLENGQNSEQFKFPTEVILDLKKASYRLAKIEDKCEVLDTEAVVLNIDANENYGEVNIEDLNFSKNEFSKNELRQDFLIQKFEKKYQKRNQVVRISFDNDIQFSRKVTIQKPTIGKVNFNKIDLNNVNFMAKTKVDAEKWRLACMRANVRGYIFEHDDFEKLAYDIWQQFESYFKLSLLTILDYENYLKENEQANFYKLMQIQAPQLLTF